MEDPEEVDEVDEEALFELERDSSSEGVVKVEVALFEDVQDDEGDEHVDDHVGQVEDVEEDEGPDLEHRLNTHFQGEVSKLNYLVQIFLVILEPFPLVGQTLDLLLSPKHVRHVQDVNDQLQHDERPCLLSYHEQLCRVLYLVRDREEGHWNHDVKQNMEKHRSQKSELRGLEFA